MSSVGAWLDSEIWIDVNSLSLDTNEVSACYLTYPDEFKKLIEYMGAILASGERSERVLKLTEYIIDENAGNYTAWEIRRECLKTITRENILQDEIEFTAEMAVAIPKNYQIWSHRRTLIEWLNDGRKEKELVNKVLELDAKNYHAWAHRQWAVEKFDLYDGELDFIDALLIDDVRNNSAWNHRFFIITKTGSNLEEEKIYAEEKLKQAVHNQSAQVYRAVLNA